MTRDLYTVSQIKALDLIDWTAEQLKQEVRNMPQLQECDSFTTNFHLALTKEVWSGSNVIDQKTQLFRHGYTR